jgi:outer membrane immunogenic protein
MKRILLAGLGLFALAATQSAVAADVPLPYKAPPLVAPTFNWTGFYIGVHGGGDFFNKDWSVPLTAFNIAGGCPGCPTTAGSHTVGSWLLGGQVGFNYQVGRWVWGVEAQASWTNLEGSNPSLFVPILTDHSKTTSDGTIAARLGVAMNRDQTGLLYVKGGGAWATDRFWTSTAAIPVVQSLNNTRWGWMVGVGVEYAFLANWSVKLEYDHMDFGQRREELACVAGCFQGFDYDVRQTIDLVKLGLNYRFAM